MVEIYVRLRDSIVNVTFVVVVDVSLVGTSTRPIHPANTKPCGSLPDVLHRHRHSWQELKAKVWCDSGPQVVVLVSREVLPRKQVLRQVIWVAAHCS